MAFTSDDLAAIEQAIASGELTVQHADGKRITYRSMQQLMQARDTIKGELNSAAGNRRPRAYRAKFSRGL